MNNKQHKNWKSYLSVYILGLLAGAVVALTAGFERWTPLRLPLWTYNGLFWTGVIAIIAYGVYVFRRQPLLSRTWTIFAVLVAMFFNGLGLVSANYIGPNRTVTTTTTVWERQYCNYRATVASPWGQCFLTLYDSPGSCPSTSSVAGYFSPGPLACGNSWPGTCGAGLSCSIVLLTNSTQACAPGETACTSTTTTNTTTYPPATVSGTTACTLPGNAGWCRGTATLNLSGDEPLSPAYSLTVFEGSPGTLCSAPSCAWTFPEGTTNLNYWVHSTYGDTSTMASASMMVDSVAPALTLTIPPANGSNGWFVSGPVTASASATDATSDVSGSASINGGGASFTASADGTYNLTASVSDVAGNTSSDSGTIKLDTTPPNLSVTVPPTNGSNGWYISPVALTGSGSDVTSGLGIIQYRVDGGGWTTGTSANTPEGVHLVAFQASDVAGNNVTVSNTTKLDTVPPSLSLTIPPANGSNGWFVSGPVTASSSATDATSGVSGSVSINGGGTSFTASTDGTYNLTANVSDTAGNSSLASGTIKLDTTAPVAGFSLAAPDGSNGWYVSSVTVTPNGSDATSGIASQQVSLDNATWSSSVTISTDGTFTVYERLSDVAGNTTTSTRTIQLDTTPPSVTVTIPPPNGSAGWYTSTTLFSTSEADAVSGVALTEYSVDSGPWQTSAPSLLDGTHSVQVRVTDRAGNTTTSTTTVNVDTTPPSSAFVSPAEGSTTVVHGSITMSGGTVDITSGAAGAEISLDDGATWLPLTLGAGGSWSYTWDTAHISNGAHTILVRAVDVAGNQEHTAKITIVVSNAPPAVSITPLWTVFGQANVSIQAGSSPVSGATITVSDPDGRWPDAVFVYSGSNLPTVFTWLGRMGDGSIAYAGRYNATVRAWDAYGNSDQATGWVLIILAPEPTTAPTVAPLVPLPTPEPTQQQVVAVVVPPPAAPVAPVVVVVPQPEQTVKKVVTPTFVQRILWPAFAFIGLLAVLASASLSDRRPRELKALAKAMKATSEIQKIYPSED
jgi:hypothetical protein